MKKLYSLLPALAAMMLLALAVSCKQDKEKAPANSPEMDSYIAEASYLNHLPDDASVLISLHPLQLFAKSGFATDDDFADMRDSLFDDFDAATRVAALAAMRNPVLAGLDPDHAAVVAISGFDTKDGSSADIYGVLPLTDRDRFVMIANKADAGLTADEDGNYRLVEDWTAVAILPDAALFYAPVGKHLTQSELRSKLDEMAAKSRIYVGGPTAESVLMGGDDLAVYMSENFAPILMENLEKSFHTDIKKLLGGNPFEGISSTVRANCVTGKVVVDAHVEGSNPLVDRAASWLGVPDKEDLQWLPGFVTAAGQVAVQNGPDILDFAQGVLDRSGRADGINLTEVLKAVGIEPKDLNEVGTLTGGYILNEQGSDDFIVVAKAGEKITSAVDGVVGQLGMEETVDGLFHVMGDIYATFKDDYAILVTGGMISRGTGSFPEDNGILADALDGNSIVVDLALGLHMSSFSHAVLKMGFPDNHLEVLTAYPEDNAAKTILIAVLDYFKGFLVQDDYPESYYYDYDDEDFDYSSDDEFDYLY